MQEKESIMVDHCELKISSLKITVFNELFGITMQVWLKSEAIL